METENDEALIPLEESKRQASEPLITVENHDDLPDVLTDQGADQQFPFAGETLRRA